MTLARLEEELTDDELQLWMAEDEIRAVECPYCGVEPRDLMDYEYIELHCPTCKSKYHRTKRTTPWPSLAQLAPSEDLLAATL